MKINLTQKLPKNIRSVVDVVTRTADEGNIPAYIVGGPVRDLMLNVPNRDLDFVVEGDGIKFAEILNGGLKGKLTIHRAFKTATIAYKGFRIDVATARRESYEKPAAYPNVRPGAIKEDLFRRDFTINAMAVCINRKNFGELVDFYGGSIDLKKGIIRVMHDRSFVDDPTRIFRAVRFSVRFDFKIEPHTKDLIKEAVSAGLMGEVNRGRLKKEMELFLKERRPLMCIDAFSKLM